MAAPNTNSRVEDVLSYVLSKGFDAKLSLHRTHVQFRICPMCGNANWNFDLELTERFIFGCWACGGGGQAAQFLWSLGYTGDIPTSGRVIGRPAPKIRLFFSAPASDQPKLVNGHLVSASRYVRIFSKSANISIRDEPTDSGFLILGQLNDGVFVSTLDGAKSFWTAPDFYVFGDVDRETRTLAVVEGFRDVFPFFSKTPTLILGGAKIPKQIEAKLSTVFPNVSRVLLVLDKDDERYALQQFRTYLPNATIFVYRPECHSPSESRFLILDSIW